MFVEKMLLPKPLFFGSEVPPRIRSELEEASQNELSSSSMKEDTINMIKTAVEILGPRHRTSNGTSNAHVSTYLPKWNNSQTSCNDILSEKTKNKEAEIAPLLATNQTLTSRVPLFGCDDSALPNESDLGIFGTVEEEQNTLKIREQEEAIDKNTVSNILGNLKCPSPAYGPDDSVSWNSRVVGNKPNNLNLPSTNNTSGKNVSSNTASQHSNSPQSNANHNDSNTRIGWWNHSTVNGTDSTEAKMKSFLKPTPTQLQKNNLPLSYLPPASTMEPLLPHLSDKSPSMRYLQMDTYEVSFACGWIEPLFCSVSIYHIDMDSNLSPPNDSKTNPNSRTRSPPRCGRVTESLWFDYYDHNPDFETDFERSLYPNDSDGTKKTKSDQNSNTTCGVFPLPSNFNVSNLFVVLIVHKALSEDSDLEPYYRNNPTSPSTKAQHEETLKYRQKAKQNTIRNGKILTPFAFGVVALEHVIGSSQKMNRMLVQIPLFQYPSGKGDIPIIDNIVHRFTCHSHSSVSTGDASTRTTKTISGLGEMTHGGKAWLILRYLGYRGVYSALQPPPNSSRNNNNSNQTKKGETQSLIPYHRIVDFTREFQIRRKHSDNGRILNQQEDYHPNSADFVCEPTFQNKHSNSYIQEMAPIPLSYTHVSFPRVSKSSHSSDKHTKHYPVDMEPTMHTSITNELLCLPRKLHHCSKRNVVIQCRLVECIWKPHSRSVIAMPLTSPGIHNTRRGNVLVDEVFTTCSYHTIDPHFLDEFKIKLPLVLDRKLSILFSVYHVHVKGKRRFGNSVSSGARNAKNVLAQRMRLPLSPSGSSVDTHNENASEDGAEDSNDMSSKGHLELLGCGILNLSSDENVLIQNDLHDIPIQFMNKTLQDSSRTKGLGIKHGENVVSPLGSEGSFEESERNNSNINRRRFIKHNSSSFSPESSPMKNTENSSLPEGAIILEPMETSSSFPRSPSDDSKNSGSKHDDHHMVLQVNFYICGK